MGHLAKSYEPAAPAAASAGEPGRLLDTARLGAHLDRLYRAAWALCGTREDAEDLVQETYARVLAKPRFLRRREDDFGYLLAALRNTFLDWKRAERRRTRTAPMPEGFEPREERSEHEPEAVVARGQVFAAVSSLPEDFRDVLIAVDVAGLSYQEAAGTLRIPKGTVMSRLYRARRHVLRLLGE